MVVCKKCGAQLEGAINYCQNCGQELSREVEPIYKILFYSTLAFVIIFGTIDTLFSILMLTS